MKKGFTLIELLAVIVILAIIALIAIPIVVNIINDSRTSSDEQTVELYVDTVEKTITKKQLSNSNFNPDKCKIQTNRNLECFKDEVSLGIIEIEMKNRIPSSGIIKINNNKISYRNIYYENKYYHKNKKGVKSITDNPKYAELINDADNNGKVSIGDKYTYDVNSDKTFNFYVLSINSDNTVNLIMDRNICNNGFAATKDNLCLYAWDSTSRYNFNGPVTAIAELYSGTKNWTNVPNMNLLYEDEAKLDNSSYGYSGITIQDGVGKITTRDNVDKVIELTNNKPIKARLPMQREIETNEAGCHWYADPVINNASCNEWIVENLSLDETFSWCSECLEKYKNTSKISGIGGYWLLSSAVDSDYIARIIYLYGFLIGAPSKDASNGIRPVITVPIEYLR